VAHEPTIREATTKNTHATVAALLSLELGCRRVLDIPCGEGAFVNRIRAAGYEVHAADVQLLLNVAGVPFTHADMSAPLPFANDSFDAVACIDGIEHIERPFDFVRECRRILRPGGVLLLSTPNISALRSRWRWLLTGFHNKSKTPLDETAPNPSHHIGLMSFPEIRYLLHSNGFRITAIAANRVKVVSWLYTPLWLLAWLVTGLVFRRWEKDPVMRQRHAEVRRQLSSVPVAFGETLIVKAACAKPGTVRRSTA